MTDVPLDQLTPTTVPPGVEVFEIRGAFFGAAEAFKETLTQVGRKTEGAHHPHADVSLLDGTGLRALRDVVRRSQSERTLVLVAEIHAQPWRRWSTHPSTRSSVRARSI